jgi:hypothetical protein
LVEILEVILGFVTAVLAGIAIKMIIDHILRPVLQIDDSNRSVIVRSFLMHNHDNDRGHPTYLANRITVRNIGKTAAKDCKAYIDYQEQTQRVAWLLPDRNGGFTITLNVKDREFVDLCAIRDDGRFRIIPPEQGYVNDYENEYAERLTPTAGGAELTLRITSSNAKPVQRMLRLHSTVDHFPNQHGRIVEFIEDVDEPLQPQGLDNI